MDLKEIKTLIDLMSKNNLSEFDLEREGFKIRLKRASTESETPTGSAVSPLTVSPALPISISSSAPVTSTPVLSNGGNGTLPIVVSDSKQENSTREIVSPMVGTFYRSPSPDSPSYAEVGQQVTEETVVCLIEAMKVMNEIKAEMKGIITEVLAENGKPVEFGKPLFRIKVS